MPAEGVPLELEQLFVRISADTTGYLPAVRRVMEANGFVERSMGRVEVAVDRATQSFMQHTAVLASLGVVAQEIATGSLSRLSGVLNTIGGASTGNMRASARNLKALFDSLSPLAGGQGRDIAAGIAAIAGTLPNLASSVMASGLERARVGRVADNLAKLFGAVTPAGGQGVVSQVSAASAAVTASGAAAASAAAPLRGYVSVLDRVAASARRARDRVADLTSITSLSSLIGRREGAGVNSLSDLMRRGVRNVSRLDPGELTRGATPEQIRAVVSMGAVTSRMFGAAGPGTTTGSILGGWATTTRSALGGLWASFRDGIGVGNGLSSSLGRLTHALSGTYGPTFTARHLMYGLAGGAIASVVAFGRLDYALSRALARMGQFNAANRGDVLRQVSELSGRTTTGAPELGNSLAALGASGMNQALSLRALPVAETFATAGGIADMVTGTRQLTQIMNGLGLASEDVNTHLANMARVSDVLVGASQRVGAPVGELATALNMRLLSGLRQVNWSIEQAVGLVGTFVNAGADAAEAGNQAATVIWGLQHALISNLPAWRAMGVSATELSRLLRGGPADVIEKLEQVFGHLPSLERQAAMEAMGFNRQITQAINPIIGFSSNIRRLTADLHNVNGVSDRTAQSIRESFGGQMVIAWNNAKNLATLIGEQLAPGVAFLGAGVGRLTDWFRDLAPETQRTLAWLTAMAALVIPGMMGLSFIGGVLSSVVGVFVALSGAPLMALTLVAASLFGVVAYTLGWERTLAGVGLAWDAITGKVELTTLEVRDLMRLFLDFGGTVTGVASVIRDAFFVIQTSFAMFDLGFRLIGVGIAKIDASISRMVSNMLTGLAGLADVTLPGTNIPIMTRARGLQLGQMGVAAMRRSAEASATAFDWNAGVGTSRTHLDAMLNQFATGNTPGTVMRAEWAATRRRIEAETVNPVGRFSPANQRLAGAAGGIVGMLGLNPLGAAALAANANVANIIPGLTQLNRSVLGGDGAMLGLPPSRHGQVGNEFRQVSLERFMIGGEAARQLEEQHVRDSAVADRLDAIRSILQQTQDLMRNQAGGPGRSPNPVILAR